MNLSSNIYDFQYRLRRFLIGRLYGFSRRADAAPVNAETFRPRKVLFVLTGLLGDSIMSAPVLVEARRLWPEAHLVLLGQSRHEELFAACPVIDEFYRFDADPFSLRQSGAVKDLQKWLDAQNFDLAAILLGDNTAPLLARAKIPVRVGVRGMPLEACLTHRYDIGGPRDWTARERLNALRCLGYEIKDSLPQLWVADEARRGAREKLFRLGLSAGEKYVALHPFGSEPRKWWSVERIAPLAARLRARYNLKTVLIGGREKVSLAGESENIVNTTGELSVGELLAVIENSLLVVTTDSGPFHIAAALNKPIIGLFRAVRPGYARIYPQTSVVFGENEACLSNCRWDFCQTDPCRQMQGISVEKVLEMINDECGMMN